MIAAPAVRSKAMGAKDQQQVWDEVRKSQRAMASSEAVVVAGQTPTVESTSSYARVMGNKEVAKQVDSVAAPMQHNYESVIRQLRDKMQSVWSSR